MVLPTMLDFQGFGFLETHGITWFMGYGFSKTHAWCMFSWNLKIVHLVNKCKKKEKIRRIGMPILETGMLF